MLANLPADEELRYWFDISWSEHIRPGVKLDTMSPNFVHINCLEFIVVQLQLTASIIAMESGYAKSILGDQIPDIPPPPGLD
jgi:hypothetical protein